MSIIIYKIIQCTDGITGLILIKEKRINLRLRVVDVI